MKTKYTFCAILFAFCLLTSGCAVLEKSQRFVTQLVQPLLKPKADTKPAPKPETSDEAKPQEKPTVLTPPKPIKRANVDTVPAAIKRKAKPLAFLSKTKKVTKPQVGTITRKELEEAIAQEQSTPKPVVNDTLPPVQPLTTQLAPDFNINGEWTIYSVRGNVVDGEERPYINFDMAAGRMYGSNGCNYINGDVYVSGHDSISIDNVIATQRMCNDAPYEYLINLALSDVSTYSAEQKGPVTLLNLKGKGGYNVMVLRRHNMDFLNGAWCIVSLNGKPMPEPMGDYVPASITFDIPDLTIHGSSGCNIFNGNLFIDPDKIHSLQLINIITTMMACPQESRQTELLLALESIEQAIARQDDCNIVDLFDQSGNLLITLKRLQ